MVDTTKAVLIARARTDHIDPCVLIGELRRMGYVAGATPRSIERSIGYKGRVCDIVTITAGRTDGLKDFAGKKGYSLTFIY
ncbi:MAG: hypothetical protein ISS48_02760 [Candidatus Aenigmarchaeota archaeon]|nr:hypothetical protein [Candidatus Aenigmarchaeota archaeon]